MGTQRTFAHSRRRTREWSREMGLPIGDFSQSSCLSCLHHNQAGGQNIYFACWLPKEMSEYDLARATVQAFYQEKKFYDYSRPYFDSRAHFTNLIWKSTHRIGIAEFKANVLPAKQVFDL
ncbi:hypothetical protein PENTCL1PPCAC_17254, partial [Pristionchus entomophagus]